MKVNKVRGVTLGGVSNNMRMDSVCRSLQYQIVNAQKEFQNISCDQDMLPEEKAKKRQQLQQKIDRLKLRLKQRQSRLF